MKISRAILLLTITGMSLKANAQSLKRYRDLIFTDVTIVKDQSYGDDTASNQRSHRFDLYQPKGDQTPNRPLIIWMHGGGFRFGAKDAPGTKLWCESFARRGYVCAAINYTLGKKMAGFNYEQLQKGCYYAVADAKMAVAYLRRYYKEYNIDPDKIILAGNSAGGMIALQAAYSTEKNLGRLAGITLKTNNDGPLKVAVVINFWGGIFDIGWLKNAQVPIVSVLGSNDRVVPPTQKDGPLYGGISIHNEANKLHIPNELKVFEGYSHELQKHFNPIFPAGAATKERWLAAGQFASDFLYKVLFK